MLLYSSPDSLASITPLFLNVVLSRQEQAGVLKGLAKNQRYCFKGERKSGSKSIVKLLLDSAIGEDSAS